MAEQDYLATGDDDFGIQLQTFKNGIGNYAIILGLAAVQTAAQAADCNYYSYVTGCLVIIMAAGAAVAPGEEVRFRALTQAGITAASLIKIRGWFAGGQVACRR